MKDVGVYRGPDCGTDNYMVKAIIICPMHKRSKEGKSELDKEIKMKVPKYKLHLFHDASMKQFYKTKLQKYIKICGGCMEESNRYLRENLHKAARVILGEEIEVRGKHTKQLYIQADLKTVVSEKKKLFLRSMAAKS